ncbi:hypothetical protein F2P79_001728 [Pimephales promelas]|nr:hypothetical protein F2P79_001728 [Pimephales promelas]
MVTGSTENEITQIPLIPAPTLCTWGYVALLCHAAKRKVKKNPEHVQEMSPYSTLQPSIHHESVYLEES